MAKLRFVLQTTCIFLALFSSGFAHHSFSNFDMEQTLTLNGVATRWEWTNPHSYLYVMVHDEKAGDQEWAVEFHDVGQLLRLGLKKDSFKAGDKINVLAHPSRDGSKLVFFSSITLPDGRTIKFR